jgi:hypothetical protein
VASIARSESFRDLVRVIVAATSVPNPVFTVSLAFEE